MARSAGEMGDVLISYLARFKLDSEAHAVWVDVGDLML